MTVSYENNFEDIVALTEHQLSTNTAYHDRRRWNLYGSPLAMLGVFSFIAITTNRPVFAMAGVAGALFSFFWTRRAYRNFPRKAVEKSLRKTPQKETFCRHSVTVSADGVTEETAESRHSQTWKAVFNVTSTPDHIFIHNTPATAHIIPRRELGDELFRQFGNEIGTFWVRASKLPGSTSRNPRG